jgi:uncharacterized protein YbjQ (UPF0145 family)
MIARLDPDVVQVLASVAIPVLLILLGLIVGGANERLHFKSLRTREAIFHSVSMTDVRTFLGTPDPRRGAELVVAEVAIANDYLKSFLAGLKRILGGEMRSYRSLMERARREAILRLAEQATSRGHNALCNVRFATADVGGMATKGAVMVVVMASATAYTTSPGTAR